MASAVTLGHRACASDPDERALAGETRDGPSWLAATVITMLGNWRHMRSEVATPPAPTADPRGT